MEFPEDQFSQLNEDYLKQLLSLANIINYKLKVL